MKRKDVKIPTKEEILTVLNKRFGNIVICDSWMLGDITNTFYRSGDIPAPIRNCPCMSELYDSWESVCNLGCKVKEVNMESDFDGFDVNVTISEQCKLKSINLIDGTELKPVSAYR